MLTLISPGNPTQTLGATATSVPSPSLQAASLASPDTIDLSSSLRATAVACRDRIAGAVIGATVETVGNTGATVARGALAVGRGALALWETDRLSPALKAAVGLAVGAALPAAAVALPTLAAIGSLATGLVAGFNRGSAGVGAAMQGALADVEAFDAVVRVPADAIEEAVHTPAGSPTPPARTSLQDLKGLAGGVVGGGLEMVGNTAVTVACAPQALVKGVRAMTARADEMSTMQKVAAVAALPLGALLVPLAVATGSAVRGFGKGFAAATEAGGSIGGAARAAAADVRAFSATTAPAALRVLDGAAETRRLSNEPKLDPRTRFCVVGAGPAGLEAARRLVAKGYDVTVIEKNSEAGGKVHSAMADGQFYDMGAILVDDAYRIPLDMAREVGVKQVDLAPGGDYVLDGSGHTVERFTPLEKLRLPLELANYTWKSLTEWNENRKPGFTAIAPELCESAQDMVDREGLRALSKPFKEFGTAMGYDYMENVPAAYYHKYLHPGSITGHMHGWEGGYQEVLKRQAALPGKKMLFDTTIQGIERGDRVTVHTDRGDMEFDQLVVATPLDKATRFLDFSPEERQLIDRIETTDYRTYLCDVENLPTGCGFIPENMEASRMGHPMCWSQTNQGTNQYVFYVLGDHEITDEEITRNISADLEKLNAHLVTVREADHWEYFPHVSGSELRNGFYEKLEAMQGQKNTTYVGEIFNFSTVHHTTQYAEHAMERF